MYKRIRDLREDKDLTQQELANMLHITQATYSRYESGDLDIPTAVLITLSKFYGVSIDYLLGQTDNPKPNDRKRH
ncbi:helix-turn-helix domain-containing protein [Paenibacillus zanthoxyli]|uniref:helix-turn-helix domain-containing protein n=1 Tax=Paenibacillus zanthoxyli TaxID=369399 RepID=UPI000472F76B|nr:helix-turn-helix transcriptional regulator [Paenibacillus zanthoxyli]